MKVLFCSKTYPIYGGVERWLAQLLPGLQQRGFEVVLALAKGHRFHDPSRYLAAYPELSTTRVQLLDGTSGITEGRRYAIESLFRREQPDVVVPVMLHEVLGAASACRMAGQTIHIAYPVHEDEVLVFRALKEYCDQIDAVVSVNQLCGDALRRFFQWPSDRLFHIRCGAPKPEKMRKATHGDPLLRLGFCGRLHEKQKRISDLAILCESLEQLNVDYHLRIVGSGNRAPFLYERLKRQIADGRVVLLGWTAQAELHREFYPQIDALVVTSDWETGPVVAWEAMMHGVLIVTSQYRGLQRENILRQGDNALIFPVGHPEQAARMLIDLWNDRGGFSRTAERGRQCALHFLSIDHMISTWANTLLKVKSLPPKLARRSQAYGEPSTTIGWIEHWLRHFLRHPYHHSGAHAEWPRYHPGSVSAEEQAKWVDELSHFERQLYAYGPPTSCGSPDKRGRRSALSGSKVSP